jgi:antitoxin component YwqK of YwqJK toxin-antitoxin module
MSSKTELIEKYWSNGSKKSTGTYINGKKSGTHNDWFENGQIKSIENFVIRECYCSGDGSFQAFKYENSYKEGVCKEWYKNGKLAFEGIYYLTSNHTGYNGDIRFDESFNGVTKGFFENGLLAEVALYCEGLRNGLTIGYFDTGEIEYKYHFINDHQDGVQKDWYKNGQLKRKHFYISGTKNSLHSFQDGQQLDWYENGVLKIKCNFRKSILSSKYESWHPNGQAKLKCNYIDNHLVDQYEEWWDNGQIMLKCNYFKSKFSGVYKSWNKNGNLKIELNKHQNFNDLFYDIHEVEKNNTLFFLKEKFMYRVYKQKLLDFDLRCYHNNSQLKYHIYIIKGRSELFYKKLNKNGHSLIDTSFIFDPNNDVDANSFLEQIKFDSGLYDIYD